MKIKEFDEMAHDLFKDTQIIDKDGNSHPVPVLWASEDMVETIVGDSLGTRGKQVEDRINLPIINFQRTELGYSLDDPNGEHWCSYNFFVRTMWQEDANQIIEQVFSKFTPVYKKDGKVCSLTSTIINNYIDSDASVKVNKWSFSIMVQGE